MSNKRKKEPAPNPARIFLAVIGESVHIFCSKPYNPQKNVRPNLPDRESPDILDISAPLW